MATLHPPPVDGAPTDDRTDWASADHQKQSSDAASVPQPSASPSHPPPPAAQQQQHPQQPPPPYDPTFASSTPLSSYPPYLQQSQSFATPSTTPSHPSGPPSQSGGAKIFVGGLSWETDEDSLRRYFEKIGPVLDCVIMRDRHTGHPRGFGFVTFADDHAAENAASRRHDLDGRQVEAKHAVPRHEGAAANQGNAFPNRQRFDNAPQSALHTHSHSRHHTTKCKVFVGGLPSGCGVDEFRSYFSRFGEVVDAQVMIDHNTGNSRGFGFVTFASEAIVTAVVGPGKSNTDHEIMGKCVEVKRAEPKGASSDRRSNRDSYSSNNSNTAGLMPPNSSARGGSSNDPSNNSNSSGTNAAASAAAAYYSNYPQNIAEQYGAFYSNPQQWQQYYAAMGYNFNAYQQAGYNPYQQYLQAYKYMSNAANSANGATSASPSTPPSSAAPAPPSSSQGASTNASGPPGSGGFDNQPGSRYGGDMAQNGHNSRRSTQRNERYHPYR